MIAQGPWRAFYRYWFLLLSFIWISGCTVRESVSNGLGQYDDMTPKSRYHYYLSEETPAPYRHLAHLAITHWNDSLGLPLLHITTDQRLADVKILFREESGLVEHPGHTALLGCLQGFDKLADCQVEIKIPKALNNLNDLATLSYLYQQGPLDSHLYEHTRYQTSEDYLRDKLTLLTLVHEIGHTLGLSHATDPSCVMAAAPRGELRFCHAELAAIRHRITLAAQR